jgi:hypothetical protein
MASAKERLAVLENVIARVGLDGDVLGEYSKAMSSLNGLQTYEEMNPVMPPLSNQGEGVGTPPIADNTQQGMMP